MDFAYDLTLKRRIIVDDINQTDNYHHHLFYCPQCQERLFFRNTDDKIPHFYHKVANPDCSYSILDRIIPIISKGY